MTDTKICFINTSKSWGGGEKWHHTAAVECSKQYHVDVITKPNSQLLESLQGSNVTTFSFNITNKSFLNPFKMYKLYRHFKSHAYQSVVLNLPADVKSAGIAAKWAGIKRIIYRRGMPHPIRNTALNRYLFGKVVTDVIVNSEEIGHSIVKHNPNMIPKSRIHIIYNGVNIPTYDKKRISPLLPKDNNVVILGTAGRCVTQKNQILLINMMRKLKAKGHKVKLLIAGTGPLLPELEQTIQENNLNDDVLLLGFVTETKAFLASLDIFVFPSHYEGSSNAIIEALAMELPVVAFDISSMPEMVIDNITGKLARYNDLDSFTNATETLITDRSLREHLSHQAKVLVTKKFNNEVIFNQITSFLSY